MPVAAMFSVPKHSDSPIPKQLKRAPQQKAPTTDVYWLRGNPTIDGIWLGASKEQSQKALGRALQPEPGNPDKTLFRAGQTQLEFNNSGRVVWIRGEILCWPEYKMSQRSDLKGRAAEDKLGPAFGCEINCGAVSRSFRRLTQADLCIENSLHFDEACTVSLTHHSKSKVTWTPFISYESEMKRRFGPPLACIP